MFGGVEQLGHSDGQGGADGRFDGHFVQGHVDGVGAVRRFERVGTDYVLEIRAPRALMKYIVEKGSIAVDGISLTVAAVGRDPGGML